MMTSEQIFKTKLIERLEQDHRAAKLRNEAFAEGTKEYSFNKATMLQAKVTLFDIKELSRDTNKMKKAVIESDCSDIHLDCPNCEMWEQLGVDDPRKMLNALPIIEWVTTSAEDNEVSINECVGCRNKFEVEWDYDNPMKG